jgi:predicted esterase
MATGTRTATAGLTEMAGFPGYFLDVPAQCVGTRRCPLLVLVHGGLLSGDAIIHKLSPLVDKYGMIVLAPNARDPGKWDMVYGSYATAIQGEAGLHVTSLPMHEVRTIDSAMQHVLRTYAIDPARIGLLGFSDGGSVALLLGRSNLDVFSRIAALSALTPFDGTGPKHPDTQFLLSGGLAENMVWQTMKMAKVLRKNGNPVTTILGLRGHVDYVADEDIVWNWFIQSWANPSTTTHPLPPSDSDPVLTVDALTKMTTFWTRFQREPGAIRDAGRMAHQVLVPLALGAEPASVIAMDMRAMAAAYPSVATDLQVAGLTAAQETAYRTAILRVGFAWAARIASQTAGLDPDGDLSDLQLGKSLPFVPIAPASVLGQNLAFRQAHEREFAELESTGMWNTQ